jgi:glycerate 2-kinase
MSELSTSPNEWAGGTMRSHFENRSDLVRHGAVRARDIALACLDAALDAADTYEGTRRIVALEDGALRVGDARFDLGEPGRIYVVGAGKGSFPIARALDELLGPRIARGVVAIKEDPPQGLAHIKVIGNVQECLHGDD